MKLPKEREGVYCDKIEIENYIEAKNILGEILPVANVCLQIINPAQRKTVMNFLEKCISVDMF